MNSKKTFLYLFSLLFLPVFGTAQNVIPHEMTFPWFDNQPHEVFDHSITMTYGGTRGGIDTYTFAPVTTVAWRSLDQVIEAINKNPKLTEEQKEGKIELLQEDAPGGVFYIYLTRYSEDEANTYNWYANISTNNDSVVWKGRLPFKAPNLPIDNGWWNFIEVPIPGKVEPPFYIFLNPNYGKTLYLFGFKVEE